MLPDKIKLFEEEFKNIKQKMNEFLSQSDAKSAFLIDCDGTLITYVGETKDLDINSFVALTAADFSAAAQLGALLGEEKFETLYHQGKNNNVYYQLVTRGIVLAAIFDQRTTLGLVRVRVKNSALVLSKLIEELFKKAEGVEAKEMKEEVAKAIEDELNHLFGE